ncbi:hypothetical protein [Agaribacterium sp. ZY112]|uniref:hypothetical protein n=1 Tax=Agaribacterium sp. ZY112 TaxID=3233574 RepID=UPI0035269F52
MKVTKTMRKGQQGARRFERKWGDRLVAVRYRYDASSNETVTTVELEVERRKKTPSNLNLHGPLSAQRKSVVAIRVHYRERELRQKIMANKAVWSPQLKLWLLKYTDAVALALCDRIVHGAAEVCQDVDTSFIE